MRVDRVAACVAAAVGYVILRLLALWISPGATHPMAVAFVYMALLMLAQVGFVVCLSRLQLGPRKNALLMIVGGLVFASLLLVQGKIGFHTPSGIVLGSTIHGLSLMLFAGSFGYWVSFMIREGNVLLPVSIFAGIVDFWGVTMGPLHGMLLHRPDLVAKASVSMPTPIAGLPGTVIGMGDFVFLGIFFGALYRFSMNGRRSFWLVYGLLTLAMLVVMRSSIAIPALVPMGIGILAANYGLFKLKREEIFATTYVGVILLVGLAVSGILMHKH